MSTNQIPYTPISDPSYRDYSRYPTQAVPIPAVRYSASPSKAMAIASARNPVGPTHVKDRPRNESLEIYRNGKTPEAMNLDSKERYYKAMLARERMWYTRLFVVCAVVCAVVFVFMALLILHFARRPASCENAGHRFHVPIFSPFSSSHERETHLQAGYSLQTAVLLASMLFIAWQNRAYISDYVLQGIVSYVRSLKGSIT